MARRRGQPQNLYMCEECARFDRDLEIAQERYGIALRNRLVNADTGDSAVCFGVEQALDEARFFCDLVMAHSDAHRREHSAGGRAPSGAWHSGTRDSVAGREALR